jgi:acyl-homoserine-lactone acylase
MILRPNSRSAALRLLAFLFLACTLALGAEKIRILRDDFGVPHIFASTPAGAAYGSGYAQAEDRLEEMMRNYRKAEGVMSEVFGETWFRHDYRQRLWRHRRVAEEHYTELSPQTRAIVEAYQAGVKQFMAEHPDRVPAWAPKLEPWQVVALGRYIIWGWPEGEAGGDLIRAGIQPDPIAYHGSNEWLIAPWRTAMHAPIALIDPHLTWYGEFRFYEMRIYGGELAYSGAAIVGVPFPTLGHSRYVSIAMTTGGPDTSDVYEEDIKDGQYRFGDEWRPMRSWTEKIGVKVGDKIDWKPVTIEGTHHGPIVAHKNGKAYSMAIPYAGEFRLLEQSWGMVTAHNLAEMKKALAMRQYMAQNIMVGTVDGDIYYVRNGRVPIRPSGCDPSKPMPGTGGCEWQGIHPFEDLVQIENPPQGYMQNCNISPWVMMKDSPLVPEKYAAHPYLYNAGRTPAHQRAAMTLEQLAAAKDVTVEQALGIAFSTEVYKADLWQERIRKIGGDSEFARLILDWNRGSDADSTGALAYYLFKISLGDRGKAVEPPPDLTDDDVRAALNKAAARLGSDFSPGAVYGTLFRVGREGSPRNWPVGGGTITAAGMATPRAISFDKKDRIMLGRGGQTSTQLVILTKPPQSWMVIPLGESDDPRSSHFDDQAEKLFSAARAKPTYFMRRDELEKHLTAVKELTY